MPRKFIFLVAFALLLFGSVIILKSSNLGTQALWDLSGNGEWLLPLIGVAALIDSINPCAFGILLITIAFLFSLGQTRARILTVGGIYILGLFAVYILIGLGILQALHLFNTPHFMAKVGALLVIAFGAINILGALFPNFPIKLAVPHSIHRKMALLMEHASLPTAFLLGLLVGLCEFPCTGGPYLMVLGLLHDQATYLSGVWYLLFYNLIFVLPLVVILALASEQKLVEKINAWKKSETGHMRLWGGIAMVALGILILLL